MIVTLCGSTRFGFAFQAAMLDETLKGNIVLTIGCITHSDEELGDVITPAMKRMLNDLHKKKIAMSDEIFILNVGGYIGETTQDELVYARSLDKKIRFLENE